MSNVIGKVGAVWGRVPAKVRMQLLRFMRIAGVTFAVSGLVPLVVSGSVSRGALLAAGVAAVEVAFRQAFPAVVSSQSQTQAAALLGRWAANRASTKAGPQTGP